MPCRIGIHSVQLQTHKKRLQPQSPLATQRLGSNMGAHVGLVRNLLPRKPKDVFGCALSTNYLIQV